MLDLRNDKFIELDSAIELHPESVYSFIDPITGKKLVAKFIAIYDDPDDAILLNEYKKLFLLSAEPEIGTVYYLASGKIKNDTRSCYVMDFIEGETIHDLIEKNEFLSYETISSITAQLASGMDKSHNFEIAHGDLHSKNVIIGEYGYVKIIDYLSHAVNFTFFSRKDLEDFKEIVNRLCNKVYTYETSSAEVLRKLCLSTETFKDLLWKIEKLNDVLFDYSFIDDEGKKIASVVIAQLPNHLLVSMVRNEADHEIEITAEVEITEEESRMAEQHLTKKVRYLDTRVGRIELYVGEKITQKLHQLKQIGLLDWSYQIVNKGERFLGPYFLDYQINLTPKLFRWKKVNSIAEFLPTSDEDDLTKLLLR